MFEHLKNDAQFMQMNLEGRRNWLVDYKAANIAPILQNVSEEERAQYHQRIDEAFWNETKKSDWETFRDVSHDVVMSVPKFLTEATSLTWKGVGAGAEMIGADKVTGYAEAQAKYLDDLAKKMVHNPDTEWTTDLIGQGLPINFFIGRTLWAYKAFTSPWAQQITKAPLIKAFFSSPAETALTKSAGMTAEAAARAYAFTGTAGDLAIGAVMNKYVGPAIDATDMSPEQKMWSTLGAYFVLGFASGVGPELALDKAIGNPLWRNTMDDAIKAAAKGGAHVHLKPSIWNNMTPEEQATVTLTHTPDRNYVDNLLQSFREANPHVEVTPEAAQHLKTVSDDIILRVYNEVADVDGVRAHAAQSELLDSPEVGTILDTPTEVIDEIVAKHPEIFKEETKAVSKTPEGLVDEPEVPLANVDEVKPKPKRKITDRMVEKRLAKQKAAEEIIQKEQEGFESWGRQNVDQYNEIVNAYKRGPIIGRRKAKEILGSDIKPEAHKAIRQHVSEIGEDGVHPSQHAQVEPTHEPTVNKQVEEPRLNDESIRAERESFEEWIPEKEDKYKKVVEAYRQDPEHGRLTVGRILNREIPAETHQAILQHISELGEDVKASPQQVRANVETPIEPVVEPVVEPPAPAQRKIAPTQPAAGPEIRTTHSLPVSEEVIDSRRVVKFSDEGKPSNKQVDVIKAADGKFDRKLMGWVLPDNPQSIEALKKVRQLAQNQQQTPVTQQTTSVAKKSEVAPEGTSAPVQGASVTGSVPTKEFVSNSGMRVLTFSNDAKPTSAQTVYMKSQGVYWNATYKGWVARDCEHVREVMQHVQNMANGIMPPNAGEIVGSANKAKAFVNHVKVRKANEEAKVKPKASLQAIQSISITQDDVVASWMRKHNIPLHENNTLLPEDLPTLLKRAYNEFGPNAVLSDEMLESHVQVLRRLEDLIAQRPIDTPAGDFKEGLAKLRKVGVLNAEAYETALKILDGFSKKLNFTLAPTKTRDFYHFILNTVNIKHADTLFHEVGHAAWWHGLTGEDRISFFRELHRTHAGSSKWNELSPMRAAFTRVAKGPLGTSQMKDQLTTSYDLVTELYADLFRQYVHTYRMTDVESAAFIRKGAKEMAPVLAAIRQLPELPPKIKSLVDKIMLMPRGENKPNVNNIKAVMDDNYRFIDRATFEDTLKAVADDAYGESVNDALADRMWNMAVAPDAWKKTGEFEPTLNRLLVEVLGEFHYGAGDIERLDRMIYELAAQFEGSQIDKTLKLIAKAETKNLEGAKIPKDQMAIHVKGLAKEYKQFINDIAAIHEAAKIHSRGSSISALDSEAFVTQLHLMLQDATAKQNARFNNKIISLTDDVLNRLDDLSDKADTDAAKWLSPDNVHEFAPGVHASNTLVRWRTAPQLIGMMMGLEVDNEAGIPIPFTSVHLNWNPVTWAKRGGPILGLYDAFGKGVWRATKGKLFQRWAALTPQQQVAVLQRWNGIAKKDFVRGILPNSGLSKDVSDIVRTKQLTEGSFKRKVDQIAKDLNSQFTPDELRLIGNVISKEQGFNVGMLSPEGQSAVSLVEQLVQDTHVMLRNAGVSQQLLDEQGLGIIPIVFNRLHKNIWKQSFENIRVRSVHETLNTKFLMPQGFHEKWKHSQSEVANLMQMVRNQNITLQPGSKIDEFLTANGQRLLAPHGSHVGTPLQTWTVKDFDMNAGTIRVNRGYTNLEKQIYRAEMSIVPRLVQFADDVSKFVARSQAYEDISGNNRLSVDIADMRRQALLSAQDLDDVERNLMAHGWQYVPDHELLPGVKRYGKLSGKLVDPEVMYAIKVDSSTAPEHPLARAIFTKYRQGVSLWKIGKTAFSVTTQGINFLGNSVMCTLDGRNPLRVLYEGITELRRKGTMFSEAVEDGMVDSNIMRSEFGLDRWMKSIEAQSNAHPTEGFYGAVSTWIDGVSKLSKNVVKKAAYVPMRAYELGDQVYKMGVFVQERKAGKSAAEAMAAANRLFFDYRDIPQGIKVIRDWGIIPFVSYTYKLIPRLADFATNNPHRLIALIGGATMFNNVLMANAFGEDYTDVQEMYESLMPEWMNRKMFGTDIRGGLFLGQYTNEQGQEYSKWLDYSQVIPGGADINDGGIFGSFPFGTNPVLSIMYGLYSNKDAQLGNEIAPYPDAEGNLTMQKRNVEARLKFILRSLLPNLPVYPGAYSLERLGQGLTGAGVISPELADAMGWTGKDYYGTQESAVDALTSWATGVRTRNFYADAEYVRKIGKLQFGTKKATNEYKRRLADQRMSPSEIAAQEKQMLGTIQHNVSAMERLSRVYEKAQKVLAPPSSEK